jgi:uncharacterized membrane protein
MSRDIRRSFIFLPILALITGLLEGFIFFFATGSVVVAFGVFVALTLFVLAMSLISVPIGLYFHRRAIDKHNKAKAGNYDLRQESSVEVDMPYHQALDTAVEAVNAITGTKYRVTGVSYTIAAKVHEVDRALGTIKAGTKQYWRSLGSLWDDNRINIRVEQINAQTSRIMINSKPTNPLQLTDYGYTLNNINTIMHYLRQASAEDNAVNHLSETEGSAVLEDADENEIRYGEQ